MPKHGRIPCAVCKRASQIERSLQHHQRKGRHWGRRQTSRAVPGGSWTDQFWHHKQDCAAISTYNSEVTSTRQIFTSPPSAAVCPRRAGSTSRTASCDEPCRSFDPLCHLIYEPCLGSITSHIDTPGTISIVFSKGTALCLRELPAI